MFLVAACAMLAGACAFNLDVEHASVFVDPEGQSGSYFGFTVSLLKESGTYGGSWLLVGAPRANSSHSSLRGINQPGAVYQCKLEESYKSCKSLVLDSKGESRVIKPNGNSYYDKLEQALIGSSLEVQGDENGRIVVCGPRWKNQFYDIQPMNGMCYWLNSSKNFNTDAGKLAPLVFKLKQGIDFEETYGYRREPNDVFYYVYGGAGMSVNFVKNSTELLVGAPGVFDWMGTIIRYRDYITSSPLISRYYTQVFIPNPFRTERLTSDSYFGYSVGSGKFFRSSEILYVGGAPRAGNLKGMVFIFDYPDSEEESLLIRFELEGFQMGEYFGSSICVIDLNSDGLDDLVVGAPQHSLLISSDLQKAGDEGRVYVFINNGYGTMHEIGDKAIIMGTKKQGARFGTAISNLGDLNNDGFPDIAVGAPYENLGHGAVYIYHGKKDGINPKFVQRIAAIDIDNSILGFGFSISRGSDIDDNNCLDIAVGAYESGNAVVFKSHSIINFHANIATNVRRINFDTEEFLAKACISYDGKHVPESLVAEIILRADPVYGRAQFILDSKNMSVHTYKVALSFSAEQCKEFGVEIITAFQDFSKPIEIKMEYEMFDAEKATEETVNEGKRKYKGNFCRSCPVVDPFSPSHVTHKVPYATGCGDDDKCNTDIKTDVSLIDVKSSFVIGSSDKMQMKVTIKNSGDPAFLSHTNITIPNITPLIRVPKNCKEMTFSTNSTDDSGLQCEMGNPLTSRETNELILELDTKNIPAGSERLYFKINSGSTGEELNPDDNIQEITVPLQTISDISITGKSSQDHFHLVKKNDFISDKIISVSHLYEVHNFGPSPVNMVNLTFHIPIKIKTSSGYIAFIEVYKPQMNLDSKEFTCTTNGYHVFADSNLDQGSYHISQESFSERREIILEEKGFRRKRRNVEDSHPSSMPSLYSIQEDKTYFVNCTSSEVICMTVECIVGPFKSAQTRAEVVLPLKMSPKLLEPVLESKDLILVSSSGKVSVLDFPKPIQPHEHRPDFVDVYTFLGKLPDSKIASWIVVLAILGGLLILLLLILLLIKMGFFKRDKKKELENLKHKSEMEESLING